MGHLISEPKFKIPTPPPPPANFWQVPKQPQGEIGQTFEVDEVRENRDAAVHGYNFFVTNSLLVC